MEDLVVPIAGGIAVAIRWLVGHFRDDQQIPELGPLVIVGASGMGLCTSPFMAHLIYALPGVSLGDKKYLYVAVLAVFWLSVKHLKEGFKRPSSGENESG